MIYNCDLYFLQERRISIAKLQHVFSLAKHLCPADAWDAVGALHIYIYIAVQ